MSSISTVTVTVPATTANLGPGFDCIGAALTLYNQFKFTRLDSTRELGGEGGGVSISVTGTDAERVQTDRSNLAYRGFVKLYEHLGQSPPPARIEISLGFPLTRGLGSSATAIVGGLVGANQLAGAPLSQEEVMQLAISMEGHPDNVVPALLGGCRLAAADRDDASEPHINNERRTSGWEICEIPWHSDIVPVLAIPDFELSTAQSRRALPAQYTRADAIFNTAHLGLLVRALETGTGSWLRVAMQDRIHQPYRQSLIPGYSDVRKAALDAGAYGMVISGAGPTLLALADGNTAPPVVPAMAEAWQQAGVTASVKALSLDTQGATCA
jgi:homoserine kinase